MTPAQSLALCKKEKRQGLLEGEKKTHLDLEPGISTEEKKLNWKGRWSLDWEGFEQQSKERVRPPDKQCVPTVQVSGKDF